MPVAKKPATKKVEEETQTVLKTRPKLPVDQNPPLHELNVAANKSFNEQKHGKGKGKA